MVLPLFAGLLVSKQAPDLERHRHRLRPDRLIPFGARSASGAGAQSGAPLRSYRVVKLKSPDIVSSPTLFRLYTR